MEQLLLWLSCRFTIMQQLYTLGFTLEAFVLTSGSLDHYLSLAAVCNLQSKHDSSLPLLLSSSHCFTYVSNDVRCIKQVLFKQRAFAMRPAETPRASDTLRRALRYISLQYDGLWTSLLALSPSSSSSFSILCVFLTVLASESNCKVTVVGIQSWWGTVFAQCPINVNTLQAYVILIFHSLVTSRPAIQTQEWHKHLSRDTWGCLLLGEVYWLRCSFFGAQWLTSHCIFTPDINTHHWRASGPCLSLFGLWKIVVFW